MAFTPCLELDQLGQRQFAPGRRVGGPVRPAPVPGVRRAFQHLPREALLLEPRLGRAVLGPLVLDDRERAARPRFAVRVFFRDQVVEVVIPGAAGGLENDLAIFPVARGDDGVGHHLAGLRIDDHDVLGFGVCVAPPPGQVCADGVRGLVHADEGAMVPELAVPIGHAVRGRPTRHTVCVGFEPCSVSSHVSPSHFLGVYLTCPKVVHEASLYGSIPSWPFCGRCEVGG